MFLGHTNPFKLVFFRKIVIFFGSIPDLVIAIYVLNHKNGTIRRIAQRHHQIGIGENTAELQIVDIELQVICHGCNEAGFPSPRRSIQQIAALPSFPNLFVKALPPQEPIQIIQNSLLQLGFHGNRVECCWMPQFGWLPWPTGPRIVLQNLLPFFHGLVFVQDMRQIRTHDFLSMIFIKTQHIHGPCTCV
jgi:hypothetical protein